MWYEVVMPYRYFSETCPEKLSKTSELSGPKTELGIFSRQGKD
jgi:hypothetical protein